MIIIKEIDKSYIESKIKQFRYFPQNIRDAINNFLFDEKHRGMPNYHPKFNDLDYRVLVKAGIEIIELLVKEKYLNVSYLKDIKNLQYKQEDFILSDLTFFEQVIKKVLIDLNRAR